MAGFRNFWLLLIASLLLLNSTINCEEDAEGAEDDEEFEDAAEEAAEGGIPEENDVMVLGADNFDEAINSNEIILVEFYAPWCGHCKTLAPKFEAAAKQLKESGVKVPLAKVDATEHGELAQRFSVSGYPTLKFFKNGVEQEYDGPREEDGIVDYMLERADPSWKPPAPAVVILTTETFNEVIGQENVILVEFFAPWCGHCKTLAPKFEKAAKRLAKNEPPLILATVDATVETELASRFGVTGYPTLKLFRKGKAMDYKGGREEGDIVDFMVKQISDPSTLKETLREVKQAILVAEEAAILGVFTGENDPRYEVYAEAAAELREDYVFLHTFSDEVATNYKMNIGDLILLHSEKFHSKYEPKWHVFSNANAISSDIQTFVAEHNIPLVGQLNIRTKEKLYNSRRPLVVFFYTVDWSFDYRQATKLWQTRVADVAHQFPDMTFVIADEEEMKDVLKEFGLEESSEDMNVGIIDIKERKYPLEEFSDWDEEEITGFLKKFSKGKLSPRIKSQAVPKKKTAVTVVVGKNFDKVVKDPKKDVLIEFYAPWCGHCKKFEPDYKKLAKKYKSDKQLVIAKCDATLNDVPEEYKPKGFPTIYFAPADNKDSPIKYEGDRDLDDLEEFISQHATVALGRAPGKDEL